MSIETFFLIGTVVFCASCLQSATGFGYGVIAGPIFLFIFNSDEALQLSALHNLAIAVILTPLIYKDVDRKFLTAGEVFTDDQIDAYIALKFEEIYKLEHTPHPIEFEMYYSC